MTFSESQVRSIHPRFTCSTCCKPQKTWIEQPCTRSGSPSHRHQLLSNQPIDQNKAFHDTLTHSHRRTETSPADDRYHRPKAADGVTASAENRGLRARIQRSRRSATSQFGGADLFWVVAFGAWVDALGFGELSYLVSVLLW